MLKKLLLVLVPLLLLGCVDGGQGFDAVTAAKASSQIQSFLNDHPNAKIAAVLLTEAQAGERLKQYPECAGLKAEALYYATFEDGPTKAAAFVSESQQKALCIVVQGQASTPTAQIPSAQPTAAPNTTNVSATPQATAEAGDETLVESKDEQNGYSILKPADWKAEIRNDQYLVVSKGDSDVLLWPLKLTGKYAAMTAADITNYLVGLIKKQYPDFQLAGVAESADNRTAMEVVATYTSEGRKLKGSFTVFKDGKGNALLSGYEAPEAEYASKEELLRKMVLSYKAFAKAGNATTGQEQLMPWTDGLASMDVPKGWQVQTGGNCETKWVQVSDAQNAARQIFAYTELGPVYIDEETKQFDQAYCQYYPAGKCIIYWTDAPVAGSATPEGFLNAAQGIPGMALAKGIPYFPRFSNLQVTGKEGSQTPVASATLTVNGIPAKGKFITGTLFNGEAQARAMSGMAGQGTLFSMPFMGVTADTASFDSLYPAMAKSLNSLKFSDQYVTQCQAQQAATGERLRQVGKTLSETSDIIVKGYEERQQVTDRLSEKWSDAILGRERVYNPETDEVYHVPNGFYDEYDINREQFVQKNLQQLEPSQWNTHAPLDGAQHIEIGG